MAPAARTAQGAMLRSAVPSIVGDGAVFEFGAGPFVGLRLGGFLLEQSLVDLDAETGAEGQADVALGGKRPSWP